MSKNEFLRQLEYELRFISKEERDNALKFYSEYFDDAGVENEREVLKKLGSVKDVAEQIMADLNIKSTSYKVKNKKNRSKLPFIILAICLSPIIIPLFIAFLVVVLAIIVALVAVVGSVMISGLAVVLVGIIIFVLGVSLFFTSGFINGIFVTGIGFLILGIGLLLSIIIWYIFKFIIRLFKFITSKINLKRR